MRGKRVDRAKGRKDDRKTFVDLFAGCGGLSLGLSSAGLSPIFSAEMHPHAFETLRANLIDSGRVKHSWPSWLPIGPIDVVSLVRDFDDELAALRGKVDVLAGGPPCQGFSTNGRRDPSDPRNELLESYIEAVRLISPRMLLLENVRGFTSTTHASGSVFSSYLHERLEDIGYKTWSRILAARDWGVPQNRERFFLVAARNGVAGGEDPFKILEAKRREFLQRKGLPDRPVTTGEAIGDLEAEGNERRLDPEYAEMGFKAIAAYKDVPLSAYARLMRCGANVVPTDLRLPRHTKKVVGRFVRIIGECKKGRVLSVADRERLGIKKRTITPLAPDRPSHTVTTLPDDMLHYSEPRILTVREFARLQSFPDWFRFRGSYTSGGLRRRNACPRYTQVGNAVPPLLAEALGEMLIACLDQGSRPGEVTCGGRRETRASKIRRIPKRRRLRYARQRPLRA